MADLSFQVRPIELADALYNAVILAADHGGLVGCPHVLICYQAGAGGESGAVMVYGASRLIAGKTTIPLDTPAPEDYASVAIARDKAEALQSLLRGYGRGKATRVGVRICEEGYDVVDFDDEDEPFVSTVNFSVRNGAEDPIAELADSDPGRKFSAHFDIVDDYLVGSGGQLAGPTGFIFDAVKRVTGLKGLESKVMDLAQTTRPHIIALAAGPFFRGIIGELDRDVYSGVDGARASHLLP